MIVQLNDETIEITAIREVKEKSGYDVELGAKIDIYHKTVDSPARHVFSSTVIGGSLKVQPEEILDAEWFSYAEITSMKQTNKLRVEWSYDAISRVEARSNIGVQKLIASNICNRFYLINQALKLGPDALNGGAVANQRTLNRSVSV